MNGGAILASTRRESRECTCIRMERAPNESSRCSMIGKPNTIKSAGEDGMIRHLEYVRALTGPIREMSFVRCKSTRVIFVDSQTSYLQIAFPSFGFAKGYCYSH